MTSIHTQGRHGGRLYPVRLVVVFALALALAVIWLVLPLERTLASLLGTLFAIAAALIVAWRSRQLAIAHTASQLLLTSDANCSSD